MSDYTLKNLHDVEDSAPKFGMEELMEARFAAKDLGLTQSGVSIQSLAPGATQPFGHHHDRQEELYVVVAGDGRVKLDDDILEVSQWDAVRVAPDVTRAFSAGPAGLEFIAFGAPAVEQPGQEAKSTPGWWDG
jgi:mannose-6-phosphate isomerase-like protein (cupin superfamily)